MKQWVMIAAVIGGFALQSAASASADYPTRIVMWVFPI